MPMLQGDESVQNNKIVPSATMRSTISFLVLQIHGRQIHNNFKEFYDSVPFKASVLKTYGIIYKASDDFIFVTCTY